MWVVLQMIFLLRVLKLARHLFFVLPSLFSFLNSERAAFHCLPGNDARGSIPGSSLLQMIPDLT